MIDGTRRRRRWLRAPLAGTASVMLTAGLLAGTPAAPAAATPAGPDATVTVEPELHDQLTQHGTADFWVYLEEQANVADAATMTDRSAQGWYVYDQLTSTAKESQAGLLALLEQHGVEYESYWIANTVKVLDGDVELLNTITDRPEVAQVAADKVYAIPDPIPAADEPAIDAVEWGIAEINADDVWADFGATGEDILVANIDSGVLYDHPALVEQYQGNNGGGSFDHNYHWWDPSSICSPGVPCDNNGHGTHTMGTILGDDGAGNQIGVAPGATWIAAKGCETSGCSQSALLSSGQWITAPTDLAGNNADPDRRPHIVNNSWGGGATTDPWYQATVQAWVAAGIFPVFSNGNSGPSCATTGNPANLVESYAVGAYDSGGSIASFSSRGPSAWDSGLIKPNIAAPGVSVRSAWNNGGYNSISGTSMAAPHVAGVVALMWSAAIPLQRDLDATRELLDTTARDTASDQCGGTPENNNVWGEGKLDAYASVEQSPRGPIGSLAGTVTDADTGDPVAGAAISATGEVDRDTTTDADGSYTIGLPVGEYTVTASAFGYGEATATVTISEDATTVADFPLTPMDAVTVSGQVVDGSGQGWPLYAHVTVDGVPTQTYTDPYTGSYSLRLPGGADYTLSFSSEYPGYGGHSATVSLSDADITLDVALTAEGCALAPGYEFGSSVGILGDFNGNLGAFLDSRGIPSTTVDWSDDVSAYDVIIVNRGGSPGEAAFQQFLADTDAAGVGVLFLDTWSTSGNGIYLLNTYLGNPASRTTGFSSSIPYLYYEVTEEHPIFDGFSVGDQIILDELSTFKDHAYFGDYSGEGRAVIGTAARGDTGTLGNGVGVQQRANNRHVLLSMHGASTYTDPLEWHADGAQLFMNSLSWLSDGSFDCEIIEGGLVAGHVTDLNSGNPLDGATVTNAAGESATSGPTPDDPALADGFYWMFSSGTGEQEFTAARAGYAADTRTVDVTAGAVTEASFTLGVGQLEVSTSELEAEVRQGGSAQREVTFSNTGSGAVQVELTERGGGFEILDGPGVAPVGEVRNLPGVFSTGANPSSGSGFSGNPQPQPLAPPWENIANYPVNIMDNAAVELDGVVYSFGGYISGAVANTYAYDTAAGEWTDIADLPQPRQKPGAAAIDGLIYVVGGWPAPAQTSTYIYDPSTDTWSQGAAMPAGRAAPGVAVVDGQLYVVAGCTDGNCATSNSVFRYDPGADSWTTVANYPAATAWLGCGGVDGKVVCAGGNAGGSASTTATHVYDPASDSWTQAANLPYDNWAMAAGVANGQLVLSAGVTDGASTVTNRSVAYDLASDTWSEIEPSNRAVYRTAGACGYYKIGGSTGGFSPSAGSEVHPDYADCAVAAADVPWLSVDRTSFTLQPGQSVTVTVTMDSALVEQDQPGTHTAQLSIRHDTPYSVDPIGVTMVVQAPHTWGKITGTVTSVSCDGTEAPLVNAIVQINGKNQSVTLITDENGQYAHWLPVAQNPVQMIVAGSWHVPQTRTVTVRPGRDTVADFALDAICLGGSNLRPV